MGFGSYDESEQQDQNVETDDDGAVNVHENDHDGAITFDTEESTEDLVGRLQQMREDDEE
ncbi:DUF5786 family protein [Natranaeroarchaeum sulfidigenes]|uniref:DUF5786 domain-containing protein n=1 Tax=Natranaeroarchaeum sulfidigenes TaxID=2784880 RepID=A0A897MZ20_9EURY|nr:DUF5786 family protein [Natranaeroarchaeum sulfidigenes]QSG04333.1 Uncharacterized protein AArcS_3146 [Natranaeroarchaeum sulfidigenes]